MKDRMKRVGVVKEYVGYKYILSVIALTAIYFFAGKIGLSLAYLNNSASPVWPPVAISLAALVLFGYRFWPGVFAGAFLVNMTITPSIITSLSIALGNSLEALIGAYILLQFGQGREVFNKVKTTWLFFLVALLVPIISAGIGVTSLILGNFAEPSQFFSIILTWWIGNVIGLMVLFPIIITWYNGTPIKVDRERYLEIAIAFLLLICISLVVFVGWPIEISKSTPLKFLCFPPILWIAFRSCLRFTSLAVFITSAIAIGGTIAKLSVFNISQVNSALIFLQIYVGVISITLMLISACIVEYKLKIRGLRRKN